jgi:PPOX class probable F420-dependent enzyme
MARLDDAWARVVRARVATLASTGADGAPHVVPCCFAVDGAVLYSAVDDKPKASPKLRRLANVAADERVSILVQHYDEVWERLWWISVAGTARIVPPEEHGEHDRAIGLLLAKYAPYVTQRLDGPVLAITASKWRTWSWE